MLSRLALTFLLLVQIIPSSQTSIQSGINFASSHYNYDSCGQRGLRRSKRQADDDIYDLDIEGKDEGQDEAQVMGGSSDVTSDNPWAVAILGYGRDDYYNLCAGTLISRRHVLTAAHCLHKSDVEFKKDKRGKPYCGREDYVDLQEYMAFAEVVIDGACLREAGCPKGLMGTRARITNITLFPFFQGQCREGDDLIIFTLDQEAKGNHACLPWLHDVDLYPEMKVSSFGWGSNIKTVIKVKDGKGVQEIVGKDEENILQKVDLGETSWQCASRANRKVGDKICVKEQHDKGSCEGDSGSGLLHNYYRRNYLVGVLSYGTPCEELWNNARESVFTDVRFFAATIDKTIGTAPPALIRD